jgi:hypothetical protein
VPHRAIDPATPAAEKAPHRRVADPVASAPGAETVPQEVVADSAEAESGAAGIAEPGADEAASPETVEQAAVVPTGRAKRGRWWRGFTGSLAAGLTVLAVGVLVVAGVCLYTGAPGPGPVLLIGHPVAAVLTLLAQRVADRRNGLPAAGAGIAVVLFTVSALTLFWLT